MDPSISNAHLKNHSETRAENLAVWNFQAVYVKQTLLYSRCTVYAASKTRWAEIFSLDKPVWKLFMESLTTKIIKF